MARVFAANAGPLLEWLPQQAKRVYRQIESNFIPIPHIKMTVTGEPVVKYGDFDIDLTPFNHTPTDNKVIVQNLINMGETQYIAGDDINFDAANPRSILLAMLIAEPEVDGTAEHRSLWHKLIAQVLTHYTKHYGEAGMKNIG